MGNLAGMKGESDRSSDGEGFTTPSNDSRNGRASIELSSLESSQPSANESPGEYMPVTQWGEQDDFRPKKKQTCIACLDPENGNEIRLVCGHVMCYGCVNQIFDLAATDESLFPPNCCEKPIPMRDVAPHIDSEVYERYYTKAPEFSLRGRCLRSLDSAFPKVGNADIVVHRSGLLPCQAMLYMDPTQILRLERRQCVRHMYW